MTDAYVNIKEWPKMLYRPASAGGVEKRIFNSQAEVPTDDGWTDADTAKANAKPAPPRQSVDARAKHGLEVQLEKASRDNAELTNLMAKADAALHDQLQTNAEQATRIADMSDFLRKIVAADGTPENVKEEAEKLLGIKTKRKTKAAAEAA